MENKIQNNCIAPIINYLLTICLTTLDIAYYSTSVQAQPYETAVRFQQRTQDGSSRGRPGKRGGTGSRRGDCPVVEEELTAFVPQENIGLAVEESPTFWLFVPYSPADISQVEFILQDEANNDVYRNKFNLPATPGIVSLSLPSSIKLAISKTYQWYFKIYCSGANNTEPVFLRAWVQRVAITPELERQLKAANTSINRIAIYAENGIWYSALNELAKLRQQQPNNITLEKSWVSFLKDVSLEHLAQKAIVGEAK